MPAFYVREHLYGYIVAMQLPRTYFVFTCLLCAVCILRVHVLSSHTKCVGSVYCSFAVHFGMYTRFTGLCWLLRQSCPHFVIFIWVMTPIKSTRLVNKFFESSHPHGSLLFFSVHFGSEKFTRAFYMRICSAIVLLLLLMPKHLIDT